MFDLGGFYFHDAAVQTNGVDDPVKQRADTRIRLADNLRYFPSRVDGIRSPFLKLWDISIVMQVPLNGRVRAQFNIEFLNAFNSPYFNPASTTGQPLGFTTNVTAPGGPIQTGTPYSNSTAGASSDSFRLTQLLGDNTSRIIQLVWRVRW